MEQVQRESTLDELLRPQDYADTPDDACRFLVSFLSRMTRELRYLTQLSFNQGFNNHTNIFLILLHVKRGIILLIAWIAL